MAYVPSLAAQAGQQPSETTKRISLTRGFACKICSAAVGDWASVVELFDTDNLLEEHMAIISGNCTSKAGFCAHVLDRVTRVASFSWGYATAWQVL